MKTFRQLQVWQKAHELTITTYQMTRPFPTEERFGLVQQMRRAAVSVAANIAEGHQRTSKQEFRRFLDIAHGSLAELQYYVLLTQDLDYLTESAPSTILKVSDEVGKMLHGLKRHINQEVRHG